MNEDGGHEDTPQPSQYERELAEQISLLETADQWLTPEHVAKRLHELVESVAFRVTHDETDAEFLLLGEDLDTLMVGHPVEANPMVIEYAPPTSGERLAYWMFQRMRERGYSDDAIRAFLVTEGLPSEPGTESAVRRIADATGATVAEVLALLGVEDIKAHRNPAVVDPKESSDSSAATTPDAEDTADPIAAIQRARRRPWV